VVHFTVSVPDFSLLSTSSVGIYIAKAPGQRRMRALDLSKEFLIASSPFSPAHQAILTIEVKKGERLMVIPALLDPHVDATFRLSCYSEGESIIEPIQARDDWSATMVEGVWGEASSGGSLDKPGFHLNPVYEFSLTRRTQVYLLLSVQDQSALGSSIGIVILNKHPEEGTEIAESLVKQSGYLLGSEACISMTLEPNEDGSPLSIVPCTSEAGKEGNFKLQVFSEFDVNITMKA